MAATTKPRTKRAKAKPATPPPTARTLETTPAEIPVDRIDRVQAWLEEQAGPLSEAYWNLHDKQQLVALAGELGVEAGANDKKSDLVARLLGTKVALPKELEAIKRPK